jgi:glycosyltransferase involved in cell wall biosynthesis
VLALPVFIRGGVPLKLIEAMARGKAIVATRELVDGLGLVDGKDVLIHGQPQEFAGAIVSLLRDEGLRQRLGAAARATFVRDFSLSSTETLLRRESVIARQ